MTLNNQAEATSPVPISEEIGARLRFERKRCGMTQHEAAAKCGIVKRTQANYEAGASDATASYLSRAGAIGFDVLYILTGARQAVISDALDHEESQMVERYRKIPSRDQRALRLFLMAVLEADRLE